jgi:hypothetical protein
VWTTTDPDNTGASFFIRPEGTGAAITETGGSWSLPDVPARQAGETVDPSVEAHWLIIPSPGAGGEDPRGTLYLVGAFVRFTQQGVEDTIDVAPDTIRVLPLPELALDYFLPIHILGDEPWGHISLLYIG